MMYRRSFVGLLALLLAAAAPAIAQSQPTDRALAAMLRAGGLVIVIRHGATNDDQADIDPLNPDNIAKQRRLNAKGEEAAKALRQALKEIGVPIGRVITSQFDRAYQTAKLAGLDQAEKSADVTEGGLVVSPNENKRRALAFRALVSTAPPAGTNVVIVTHKPNIIDAFGKDWFEVKEGETTIFRPVPPNFQAITRLQIDEWPRIAAASKR
jgi:broad specificity phosphatase PhoE